MKEIHSWALHLLCLFSVTRYLSLSLKAAENKRVREASSFDIVKSYEVKEEYRREEEYRSG